MKKGLTKAVTLISEFAPGLEADGVERISGFRDSSLPFAPKEQIR